VSARRKPVPTMAEERPEPTTRAELYVRWSERDGLYVRDKRNALSDRSVDAVRVWRQQEAGRLPDPNERADAWLRATRWSRP
jgi:hypothetical protein